MSHRLAQQASVPHCEGDDVAFLASEELRHHNHAPTGAELHLCWCGLRVTAQLPFRTCYRGKLIMLVEPKGGKPPRAVVFVEHNHQSVLAHGDTGRRLPARYYYIRTLQTVSARAARQNPGSLLRICFDPK